MNAKVQEQPAEPAKKIRKKNETVVYVGPTITGLAMQNTTFNNGIPEKLQGLIKERPILGNLLIPISSLSAALGEISRKEGAAFTAFKAALKGEKTE